MADNFTINTVTGQVTLRATDDAGILTEHVIVESSAVADGDDAAIGATTDAAVTTDAAGTVSAKLRGLVVLFVNFLSRLPAALGANGGLKIEGVASGTDVPVTLDSEVVAVDATGQGDVPVTLDGEAVVLGAGAASIGTLGANSGVDIGDVDVASIAAGDNNIGNVDVVTLPATPAGTNLIGKTSVGQDTASIYSGTTALTPKFAVISGATSGNNTIVAAVAGKKIRVLAYHLVCADAVDVRFESAADGTALTGVESYAANGGINSGFCPVGHFETAAAELLNMELGGAVQVSGSLTYVEV